MRARLVAVVMLLLPACGPLIVRERAPTSEAAPPSVHANANPSVANAAHDSSAVIPVPEQLTPVESKVAVYPKGSDPKGRTMVVGVLDLHTSAQNADKGFDVLRVMAAQLGADAVIGAEFEHGEGAEPSHLSGMAIRYMSGDEKPYVVLGKIDIATAEDADDKGYDAMRLKAASIGADEVIDVKFEHGEEGGLSHLTGTAVRHVTK